MTNKEAIKVIGRFRTYYGMVGEELQAISVATDALKKIDALEQKAAQSSKSNSSSTKETKQIYSDTKGERK